MLQISDPWLVAEVLDKRNYPHALDKPTSFPYNFYQGFNQARARPAQRSPAQERPLPAQSAACRTAQVTSSPPTHSQLTCKTSDPLWRLVRRGSAPALSPANLRCAARRRRLSGAARLRHLLRQSLKWAGALTGAARLPPGRACR